MHTPRVDSRLQPEGGGHSVSRKASLMCSERDREWRCCHALEEEELCG
jgi:hypothetical protein